MIDTLIGKGETTSGWQAFDCHTVLIEDKELSVRIEAVPEEIDSSFQKVSFSKCLVTMGW